MGKPKHVFISHSHHDDAQANEIAASLEAAQLSCFLDHRDIVGGEIWIEAVLNGIESSSVMLLVVSSNGNQKPDMLIRELQHAVNHRVPILPVKVEDIEIERMIKFLIGAAHILRAHPPPVSKHAEGVVHGVRHALAITSAAPQSQETRVTVPPHKTPRFLPWVMTTLFLALAVLLLIGFLRDNRLANVPLNSSTAPTLSVSSQPISNASNPSTQPNPDSLIMEAGSHIDRAKSWLGTKTGYRELAQAEKCFDEAISAMENLNEPVDQNVLDDMAWVREQLFKAALVKSDEVRSRSVATDQIASSQPSEKPSQRGK